MFIASSSNFFYYEIGSFAGGRANGRPAARNERDPLGDGWSEHGWAVRRDRTRHPLLHQFVLIFFNDRVRQQLLAHGLDLGFRLVFGHLLQLQLHVLADAHVARILESQRLQRMLDRLPLRIENARLQRHMNLRLHSCPPDRRSFPRSEPERRHGCSSLRATISPARLSAPRRAFSRASTFRSCAFCEHKEHPCRLSLSL